MIAVVCAIKDLTRAKSRLDVPEPLRARLAFTMLLDTVRAWTAAGASVWVSTDRPQVGAELSAHGLRPGLLQDAGASLDACYASAAETLTASGVETMIGCVADLPALTADAAAAVLRAGRGFVPDAAGTGTTMVVAAAARFVSHFGPMSAARHRGAGLTALDVPLAARLDVDDLDALAAAAVLGLGPATAPLWGVAGPASCTCATLQQGTEAGWSALTADGAGLFVPADALDPALTAAQPGQRVHLAVVGGQVRSAWPHAVTG